MGRLDGLEARGLKIASRGESAEVRLEGEEAVVNGRRMRFSVQRRDGCVEAVEIEGRIFRIRAIRDRECLHVWCGGQAFALERGASARAREASGDLIAPMPGRVRKILVGIGDRIVRGQVLLVLEAMKMEHAIRAPRDGAVLALAHKEGDLVEAGAILAELASDS